MGLMKKRGLPTLVLVGSIYFVQEYMGRPKYFLREQMAAEQEQQWVEFDRTLTLAFLFGISFWEQTNSAGLTILSDKREYVTCQG
jgi:hypothetical protein